MFIEYVRDVYVVCTWSVCGVYVMCTWFVYSMYVMCMWCVSGMLVCTWFSLRGVYLKWTCVRYVCMMCTRAVRSVHSVYVLRILCDLTCRCVYMRCQWCARGMCTWCVHKVSYSVRQAKKIIFLRCVNRVYVLCTWSLHEHKMHKQVRTRIGRLCELGITKIKLKKNQHGQLSYRPLLKLVLWN